MKKKPDTSYVKSTYLRCTNIPTVNIFREKEILLRQHFFPFTLFYFSSKWQLWGLCVVLFSFLYHAYLECIIWVFLVFVICYFKSINKQYLSNKKRVDMFRFEIFQFLNCQKTYSHVIGMLMSIINVLNYLFGVFVLYTV